MDTIMFSILRLGNFYTTQMGRFEAALGTQDLFCSMLFNTTIRVKTNLIYRWKGGRERGKEGGMHGLM